MQVGQFGLEHDPFRNLRDGKTFFQDRGESFFPSEFEHLGQTGTTHVPVDRQSAFSGLSECHGQAGQDCGFSVTRLRTRNGEPARILRRKLDGRPQSPEGFGLHRIRFGKRIQ